MDFQTIWEVLCEIPQRAKVEYWKFLRKVTFALKQLGKLKAQLQFVDIHDIFSDGLHEYIDDLQKKLNTISTAIYESFFANKYVESNSKT